MKLNRRESEARKKIIQEYQLRKKEQMELDRLVREREESYCNVYSGTGISAQEILKWVLMDWNMNSVCVAVAETGVTAQALAEEMYRIQESYNKMKEAGNV